jgi:gluconolactonase
MTHTVVPFTVLASNLRFPEGPVALSDGSLVVVEIAAGRLTHIHPDGRTQVVASMGGGPNGAALGPDGALYLCNNGGFRWADEDGQLVPIGRSDDYSGGRIERVDASSGEVRVLHRLTQRGALSGPNDLVFDSEGGLWFTELGHVAEDSIERGAVCYAPAGGGPARAIVYPMLTPNGIGLSPNGRTLYVAETFTARLWAFDLADPGQLVAQPNPPQSLKPGRLLYAADCDCAFDSLAVEADGHICVATIGVAEKQAPGGACFPVVSAQGDLVERVYPPDRGTTNLCFGGDGMRTADVTQSRTGQVLSMPWPRPSLKTNFPH